MPDFGMSYFAIFPALWRLHESSALVPFLIHPFHQDVFFAYAVPLEFLGSETSFEANLAPDLELSILRRLLIPSCRYLSGRTFRLRASRLWLRREGR
jgi:hypothetical protein